MFYISVLLPKVHQRYDLDGDASMAKVSNYDFNLYTSDNDTEMKVVNKDFKSIL